MSVHAARSRCGRGSHRRGKAAAGSLLGAVAALVAAAGGAGAQPGGVVRYTPARAHVLQREIELPGTVEARLSGPVTTEVQGYVTALLAREGDAVRRGQPIARLRKSNFELQLRAARGQLQEAEAQRGRAQRALERARRLLEQKLVAEEQFDDARAELLTWEGRVARLTAEVERTELDLERCTIRAPWNGVVVAEHVEVGSWIGVGAAVVDLVSSDRVEVRIEVPGRDFGAVRVGSPAQVTRPQMPATPWQGRIAAIIPRSDPRARVFPVTVQLDGDTSALAAGMLVQVRVPAGAGRQVTIVPKDALVRDGDAAFVLLLAAEDRIERRPVRVGEGLGEWVEVRGLDPGARVITRGNERVFPGQHVEAELLEYTLP